MHWIHRMWRLVTRFVKLKNQGTPPDQSQVTRNGHQEDAEIQYTCNCTIEQVKIIWLISLHVAGMCRRKFPNFTKVWGEKSKWFNIITMFGVFFCKVKMNVCVLRVNVKSVASILTTIGSRDDDNHDLHLLS